MKRFTLLLATVLMSALAQAAMPVEGSWGMQQSDNGFQFDMTLTVAAAQVSLTNVCSYQGRSAQAQVIVPAAVSESSIRVLASASNSQSLPGINCDVNIQTGELNYVVQGNTLILSQPGNPQQMVLIRR